MLGHRDPPVLVGGRLDLGEALRRVVGVVLNTVSEMIRLAVTIAAGIALADVLRRFVHWVGGVLS